MSASTVASNHARAGLRPAPVVHPLPALQSTRLLDQLRERIRLLHYSRRTEDAYVHWCRAFIRFHGIRHPAEMSGPEVEAFLTWLAVERGVDSQASLIRPAVLVLKGAPGAVALDERAGASPGPAALAGGAVAGRSGRGVPRAGGRASAIRAVAVWNRHATDRRIAAAGQGRGLRAPGDRRARARAERTAC